MKWIDLFQFLNEQANNMRNVGKFDWQAPVIIHDANTGDELTCDTYYISDNRGTDRLVLITNIEEIFNESSA